MNKADVAYDEYVLESARRKNVAEAKLETMRKDRDAATAKRDAGKAELQKYAAIQPKLQAFQAKTKAAAARAEAIKAGDDELAKLKKALEEKTAEMAKRRDTASRQIQDSETALDALGKIGESYGDQETLSREKLAQQERLKLKLSHKVENVDKNIEEGRIDHKAKLSALEQEKESIEASIANVEAEKEAKKTEREELWEQRKEDVRVMEEEIRDKKRRAENLDKAGDMTTARETLFRHSVYQGAAELLEDAQQYGDIEFTV